MAVPGALTNYSVSTTNNGNPSTNKEGGTILGNDNTGDVITKAFELITATKDNYNAIGTGPITGNGTNAMVGAQKVLAAGTFAYHVAGEYVIARASATLSGVAKTQLLTMGAGDQRPSIAQFYRQIGAKILTAFRSNRFSWTSTKSYGTAGAALTSRLNWVAATTAGGNAAAAPDTLSGQQLRAIGGATRNGTAADADYTDAAANGYVGAADVDSGSGLALADTGLRKVPGRLVIKSNFVNLNPWTSVKTSARPDFNNYKPITG